MGTEVEKAGVFGGRVAMVDTAKLKEALASSASMDPRGAAADGSDYINFSGKRGVFEVGVEKRDIETDELWLVNVPAFEDGWICWKGGQVIALRLAPLGQPVPVVDTTEHGPFTQDGDGWSPVKSMTVRSLDTGQQGYFKINSVSGVSAMAGLQKEITQRLMAGSPCWPVIGMGKEQFTSRGYKNFKPVFVVDGWLNDDQVMGELADVFEDEEAELDLEALYAAASAPTDREEEAAPKKARRSRRTA